MILTRSDEDLLARFARDADASALEALIERHFSAAFRRAHHMLGDPAAAEDAVQNALIALARNARRFRAGEPFAPWFGRILQNKIRDEARRVGARRRREEKAARLPRTMPAAEPAPLRAHLDQLPYELRAPLALHFLEGLSHRRLAAELGWSAGSVSGRIRRGLERLRASLSAAGYGALVPSLEDGLRRLAAAPRAGARPTAALIIAGAAASTFTGLAAKSAVLLALLVAGLSAASFFGEAAPESERRPAAALPPARAVAARASRARSGSATTSPSPSPIFAPAVSSPATRTTSEPLIGAEEALLSLTVLDSEGRPAARAPVCVAGFDRGIVRWNAFQAREEQAATGITDQLGRCQVRVSLKELAGLRFAAEAWLDGDHGVSEFVDLKAGSRAEARIRLRPFDRPRDGFGALLIQVYDRELPAANVLANVFIAGSYGFEERLDSRGRLRFPDLPEGDHELLLQVPGCQEKRDPIYAHVRSGEVTRLRLDFQPECLLEGAILAPPELPPERIDFEALRQGGEFWNTVTVDVAAGRYRCRGLGPGRYRFRVGAPGVWPREFAAELPGPGSVQGPNLDLTTGAAIRGRILMPDGQPADDVLLFLSASKATGDKAEALCSVNVNSDREGRFEFRCLPPGAYQVMVSIHPKLGLMDEAVAALELGDNDVELPERTLPDKRVRPRRQAIEVELVDGEGRPFVAEAHFDYGGEPERLAPNRYRLQLELQETGQLWAWSDDGRVSKLHSYESLRGLREVTLALSTRAPSFELELDAPEAFLAKSPLFVLKSRDPIALCFLSAGADGLLQPTRPLQPGRYELVHAGYRVAPTFELAAGERRRLKLSWLRGASRLRVDVRGARREDRFANLRACWFKEDGSVAGYRARELSLPLGDSRYVLDRLSPGPVELRLLLNDLPSNMSLSLRRRVILGEGLNRVELAVPRFDAIGSVRCRLRLRHDRARLIIYNDSLRFEGAVFREADQEQAELTLPVLAGRFRAVVTDGYEHELRGGAPLTVTAGQETAIEDPPALGE